jgi:hypothetical protein
VRHTELYLCLEPPQKRLNACMHPSYAEKMTPLTRKARMVVALMPRDSVLCTCPSHAAQCGGMGRLTRDWTRGKQRRPVRGACGVVTQPSSRTQLAATVTQPTRGPVLACILVGKSSPCKREHATCGRHLR